MRENKVPASFLNSIHYSPLKIEHSIPQADTPVRGTIRVLVADDNLVMRQGLAGSLRQEPDMVVVGEAVDGASALERSRTLHPDVILMDLGMPNASGIEATRIIHSEMPGIRIIGLSIYEEMEKANAMHEAGAAAYLNKCCSLKELKGTIRECAGNPPVKSFPKFSPDSL
jgi:DNA-binding NarL/FixJ family response regulator